MLLSSLTALALIVAANLTAWAAGRLLRERFAAPLDFGITLKDGSRLLGDHKTWRGLLAGSLACGLTARAFGYAFMLGVQCGALSLLADALSSFVKRRLHRAPGDDVPGLDQLPEALLPLWFLSNPLRLSIAASFLVALVFLFLNLTFVRLRRHGVRYSS
jgi:uncharacterized protein